MTLSKRAAIAVFLALALLGVDPAYAQNSLSSAATLPTPCFPDSPVNRATGASRPPAHALEQAIASKRATEQLALQGGNVAPRLAASAQDALKAAIDAFGPSDRCIAPFLEEAGVAAAETSDLKTAEADFRRALMLLPDRPDTMFYRATLAESLASLLSRDNQPDAAAEMKAQADRLRSAAQAAYPFEDIYTVMQSSIGSGPADAIFLGPTAGAQALNGMAIEAGIYDQPFNFQLYGLHAQSTLHSLADVPGHLRYILDRNQLDALREFAIAQDDQPLLAEITEQDRALIARIEPSESRLTVDRERGSLIEMLRAQGRLDEMEAVANAIAPESLAADENLALDIDALRGDLMLRNGNPAAAWPQLQKAQALLTGRPLADHEHFFALEHAVADLRAHDFDSVERHLAPLAAKDTYGATHQSKVLRLVAQSAYEQGKAGDAARAIRQAIAVTEADKSGQDEGPLGFGTSENTHELAQSVNQAVTLALGAPGNPELAESAAELVLRVRGHQLALTAARFRELREMPLGAQTKLRDLRVVRARLARELRDLGLEPDATPNWPVLDAILAKEYELQLGFAVQTLGHGRQSAEPDLPAIMGKLGDDAAVVVYVIYRRFDAEADALDLRMPSEPRMAAALLRPGRRVRWIDLGTVTNIDTAVENLRAATNPPRAVAAEMTAGTKAGLPDPANALKEADAAAQLLFGPWRAELAGLRRVVLAPDGSLNLAPFAALLPPDAKKDQPALSVIASIADLSEANDLPQGQSAILANPDFDAHSIAPLWSVAGLPPTRPRLTGEKFPDLPGTQDELRKIQTVLPDAATFTGAAANKATLVDLHKPWILHIATHADFRQPLGGNPSTTALLSTAGNPMLTSALVFAGVNTREVGEDALATALELSSLDLDGTQLVVLSACDTGLGGVTGGEGVFGLRRAFATAGARRVLLSLWKVDDAATAFLMGAFYQALKDGQDVDTALAHAQTETRGQPGWAHPYYWAAFILSGAHSHFQIGAVTKPGPMKAEAPSASPPLRGETLWTYHTGGRLQGAPAVDGRLAIIGSEDNTLYAIDRTTGALVWRFDAASRIFDQPQITGDRVFFGAENGSVYALDESNGRAIWQTKVSGTVYASVTVDQGIVYVAAGQLSALDAATGNVRWAFDPGTVTTPAPIGGPFFRTFGAQPSLDMDFIYIGDHAGRLYKLRRSDGQPVWTAPLGAGTVSRAILDGKQVIVATWGGSVIAFDRNSGAQLWRYELNSEIDDQLALMDGKVVFGTNGFLPLTAIDARTGDFAWTIVTQARGVWSLVAAGQQLLIGSLNGLWLVDRNGGDIRRLVEAEVTATPVVQDGVAYFGGTNGTLYAVR